MRPEVVSQGGERAEATWLRPLPVSPGAHAATPHPRRRKENKKTETRNPRS